MNPDSNIKFLERVAARKSALRAELVKSDDNGLLSVTDDILYGTITEDLKDEFLNGFEKSLVYSLNNKDVCAVLFTWYFSGDATGEAVASALGHFNTTGDFSRKRHDREVFPIIEMEVKSWTTFAENISSIPVERVFNEWAEVMNFDLETALEESLDAYKFYLYLMAYMETHIFQTSIEVMCRIDSSLLDEIKRQKNQFWITMTSYPRGMVPVLHL